MPNYEEHALGLLQQEYADLRAHHEQLLRECAILKAEAAFHRELASQLRERPGQWVAYDASGFLATAKTKAEVFRICTERGLERGGFLVRCVEPEMFEASFEGHPAA